MKVSFQGGAELAATLRSLPTRISRPVQREALFAVAEPMRARMARLAPREPGAPDIADNIVISGGRGGTDKSTGQEKAISVAIGPSKGFIYGFFQEYGTSRHGAQPFMRPAFDSEAPKVVPALAQALWVELAGRGINPSTTTSSAPMDDSFGGTTAGLGAGSFQYKIRGKQR